MLFLLEFSFLFMLTKDFDLIATSETVPRSAPRQGNLEELGGWASAASYVHLPVF